VLPIHVQQRPAGLPNNNIGDIQTLIFVRRAEQTEEPD
jgi:hypothetical protein